MSKLADRLLEKMGKGREDFAKTSRVFQAATLSGVRESKEFTRVLELPRRKWQAIDEETVSGLTSYCRKEGGTMNLRPLQAAALQELHDYGGVFCSARVGAGKTIISALAGAVCEAKRPLLIIPAKLRKKTERDFALLSSHFQFVPPRVISYELLGRAQHSEFLEQLKPDLVIADECHKLKNRKAAVTRRVGRYIKTHRDGVRFAALSGTITKTSLLDFAHVLEWANPHLFPLPRQYNELNEWAMATDAQEGALLGPRMKPGALVRFMSEEEQKDTDQTRACRMGLRRRINETPAVVATEESAIDASLDLCCVVRDDAPPEVEEAYSYTKAHWETPDGWQFAEATDLWRHLREIALGFYYVWDPRPPREWMEARASWYRFVRHLLQHNRDNIDSMWQAALAIDQKTSKLAMEGADLLERWRSIKTSFKPNTVPNWLAPGWLTQLVSEFSAEPGIIWVEHIATGAKLHELHGLPYFGSGGVDGSGRHIEDARGDEVIVASITSSHEGRNLQQFSRNLVLGPPSDGAIWEQLAGRTHRDGQLADVVEFQVPMTTVLHWTAMQKAKTRAERINQITGQEQKLTVASFSCPSPTEMAGWSGPRWE